MSIILFIVSVGVYCLILTWDNRRIAVFLFVAFLLSAETFHKSGIALGHQLYITGEKNMMSK